MKGRVFEKRKRRQKNSTGVTSRPSSRYSTLYSLFWREREKPFAILPSLQPREHLKLKKNGRGFAPKITRGNSELIFFSKKTRAPLRAGGLREPLSTPP